MELFGEYTPWVSSYEVDRLGVHRVVVSKKYADILLEQKRDGGRIAVGVPWVRTTVDPEEGGGNGVINWFHEGVPKEELSGTPEVFEFEGSFNQQPITAHPNIQTLIRNYRGRIEDGRIVWPARIGSSASSGGLGGSRQTQLATNPLFGVEDYLALGAVWKQSKVYDAEALPDDLLEGVGLIFENPPGNPNTPRNRNWLKMAPLGRTRGNVTEVTNAYLLSGFGGWLPAIYDGSDLA